MSLCCVERHPDFKIGIFASVLGSFFVICSIFVAPYSLPKPTDFEVASMKWLGLFFLVMGIFLVWKYKGSYLVLDVSSFQLINKNSGVKRYTWNQLKKVELVKRGRGPWNYNLILEFQSQKNGTEKIELPLGSKEHVLKRLKQLNQFDAKFQKKLEKGSWWVSESHLKIIQDELNRQTSN